MASAAIGQAEAAACMAGCLESYNGQECLNRVIPDRDCGKILDEIAKAKEEMQKAQDEYDKGNNDKAIDHHKKAWEHAQHAIKKTVDEESSDTDK